MFYCSTSRNVPFFELNMMPGEMIAISKWRTLDKLTVNNIGYTNLVFSELNSNRSTPEYGELKQPTEIPLTNSLIDEFLSSVFTKVVPERNEYLYKLLIAIAEKMFSDDMFDGLLYPTIAMRANADNLAIKPRYIDSKKLELVNIEFIGIDTREGIQFTVTDTDFANSIKSDGTIEWKGRRGHWVLRNQGETLQTIVENGRWVARDPNGKFVEME